MNVDTFLNNKMLESIKPTGVTNKHDAIVYIEETLQHVGLTKLNIDIETSLKDPYYLMILILNIVLKQQEQIHQLQKGS